MLPAVKTLLRTGSPVAAPKVMVGMVSVLAICCQELTCVNSPPKEKRCAPFMTDTLSAISFTGELRRCELVAVVTGET